MREFEKYLSNVRDFSNNTIKSYLIAISQFKKFIDCDLKNADINDIDKFVSYMQSQNYQNKTINLKINGIKCYYKFLSRSKGIDSSVLQREQLSTRETQREIVDSNEVDEMLSMLDSNRKKAMLSILFQTGVRISELINIKREHLTKFDEYVRIIIENSKRKKDRMVFMSKEYFEEFVEGYLNSHTCEYVIANKWNSSLSSRQASRLIKQISKETIGKELSAHDYRASCFTHLHRSGMDIYRIAELAGHSSIQTTQKYIQADEQDLSREFMQSFGG